jgi:hypothetical protein
MDVQVRRWRPGTGSAHSGGAGTWDDPVPFPIMGWSPSLSSESPIEGGANRVLTRRTVYAWQMLSHRDILVMDGHEWQVTQDVSDWNQGPYGWQPGYVFTVEQNRG